MKMTGVVVRFCCRASLISLLVAVCLIGVHTQAQDVSICDQIVTNENQLAGVFSCNVFSLPVSPPDFQAWLLTPQFLWADFTQLPPVFGAAFAQSQEQVCGLTVLKLRLTRAILTGETLIEFLSCTNNLTLAAPTDYQPSQQDWATKSALQAWQQWVDWGDSNESTTPTLWLDIALADVQDKPAYDAALAVEDAACMPATLMSARSFATSLDESIDDMESIDATSAQACGRLLFNKLQVVGTNFFLEWFSITNATYEIAASTSMTASSWTSLASLYSAASGTNLTSFLDVGGAANTAKFYKVAKTGISIALCDSNTLFGVVDIPVEIGMPSNQPLTGLYFLLDGQPSASITAPQFPVSALGVPANFNTVIVSNGLHTLQAFAEFFSGNFSDSSGGYDEYASATSNVQVLNPISLDIPFAYGDETGSSMTFPIHATLSTAIARWTVAVNSSSNTLLKTYSGTTSNADVYVEWDGTDQVGSNYTGSSINVLVTTVTSNQSGGFSPLSTGDVTNFAGQAVYKTATTNNRHDWSLAYQSGIFSDCNNFQSGSYYFCHMFYDDGAGYSHGGLYNILTTDPGSYNVVNSNHNGFNDSAALITSTNDWVAFWQNFKGSNAPASFFLFSHGSPTELGNGNNKITIAQVKSILGNYISNGVWVVNTAFRFGQFDGCNTLGWEEALGIPSFKTNVAYFSKVKLNPRACLTWHTKKIVGFAGNFNQQHGILITGFYYDWLTATDYPNLQAAYDHNFNSISSGSRPDIHGAADMGPP